MPPTGPGRKSVGVWGCPLTPGPTLGGIGAAHGSQEQFRGSTGMSRDPSTNSWRDGGVPLKQLRGRTGASPGPTSTLEGQCLRACT